MSDIFFFLKLFNFENYYLKIKMKYCSTKPMFLSQFSQIIKTVLLKYHLWIFNLAQANH